MTRSGRLRRQWAAALAERDPVRCLDRLRAIWTSGTRPDAFTELWPAFLDSVLRGPVAPLVQPADLTALEDLGFRLTPGLSQAAALGPLVATRDARRQPQAAAALLTRMYHAPHIPPEERVAIARALAGRGARGDDQLRIYITHLRATGTPLWAEPAMLALLTDCLVVGFDADPIRLKRAGELAGALRAAALPVPGIDLALGFANLLVEHHYPVALSHLTAARTADPADFRAFLGLLVAWLHNGDHDLVVAAAHGVSGPVPSVVAELAELCRMLVWLEDPAAPGPPPTTPRRLKELTVRTLAGDWLDFAVGRAQLLAGDAGPAAATLTSLADGHPERPQWNYHAAWALLLCGDRDGVARRLRAVRQWRGGWSVACLALDADPGTVDGVAAELDGHATPDAAHVDVVAARLALARRQRPAPVAVALGRSVPEALESVRTMLGQRLIGGTTREPADPMTRAALAHLPYADQLLWAGLTALPTDPGRGRAILAQAAHRYGYPRAALVLAVHYLEDGRYGEADQLLANFDWRTDPDFQVLRTWARARTDDDATVELGRAAAAGNSRAHYALGGVYLGRMTASSPQRRRVFAQQVVAEFGAALADPDQPVPADATALAGCAALIHTGEPASVPDTTWAAVERLPTTRRTPWLRWLAGFAAVAGDPAGALPESAEQLVDQLEDLDDRSDDLVGAVVAALTCAGLAKPDPARARTFADLVGQLARLTTDERLGRWADIAAATAVRLGGDVEPAASMPLSALASAEAVLAGGDTASAAQRLHRIPVTDDPVYRIVSPIAELLDGRTPGPDAVIEVRPELPRRVQLAIRAVDAAVLTESDPERSITVLAPAVGELELAQIVDLRRGLPIICAVVGRRREPPGSLLELIQGVAATSDGDDDLVMLARCAAAVGDQRLAATLWRDALAGRPEPTDDTRAEYVRVLCHQAVVARRAGDPLEAAYQLLLAARVGSGRALDRSVFTADEIAALNATFETATADLRDGAAAHRANDEWQAMNRCLGAARELGDERAAVLMFAQMEDLLDLVAAGAV